MDSVITVRYKDNVKVVPYEGKNVFKLRQELGATVLHAPDSQQNRKAVPVHAVKAYINGKPAEDGDIVGLGETLEFSENPLR